MTSKRKILMVSPVVPYPLRENGTALRYLPVIDSLHSQYQLDIVIIDDVDADKINGLAQHCSRYAVVKKPAKGAFSFFEKIYMNISRLLPWTIPYAFQYYQSARVRREITQAAGDEYNLVIWITAACLTLLPGIKKKLAIDAVIIDFIDSPYLLTQRQMATQKKTGLIQRYELWKTRRWEKKIQHSVDNVIYISDIDAGATGEPAADVTVIPNGVNIDDYSEAGDIHFDGPTIGYLGNMSYGPNVDAVLWVYNNLLGRLNDASIRLVIIGKDPHEKIKALSTDPRVVVTGMVENIWEYVNAVDIFVLPIFAGAGLKNKVLELMYAGKPLITTEIGNEGIDAKDGNHVYICKTADEFTERLEYLFEHDEVCRDMGAQAKAFVEAKFEWSAIIERFHDVIRRSIKA